MKRAIERGNSATKRSQIDLEICELPLKTVDTVGRERNPPPFLTWDNV